MTDRPAKRRKVTVSFWDRASHRKQRLMNRKQCQLVDVFELFGHVVYGYLGLMHCLWAFRQCDGSTSRHAAWANVLGLKAGDVNWKVLVREYLDSGLVFWGPHTAMCWAMTGLVTVTSRESAGVSQLVADAGALCSLYEDLAAKGAERVRERSVDALHCLARRKGWLDLAARLGALANGRHDIHIVSERLYTRLQCHVVCSPALLLVRGVLHRRTVGWRTYRNDSQIISYGGPVEVCCSVSKCVKTDKFDACRVVVDKGPSRRKWVRELSKKAWSLCIYVLHYIIGQNISKSVYTHGPMRWSGWIDQLERLIEKEIWANVSEVFPRHITRALSSMACLDCRRKHQEVNQPMRDYAMATSPYIWIVHLPDYIVVEPWRHCAFSRGPFGFQDDDGASAVSPIAWTLQIEIKHFELSGRTFVVGGTGVPSFSIWLTVNRQSMAFPYNATPTRRAYECVDIEGKAAFAVRNGSRASRAIRRLLGYKPDTLEV